MGLVFFNSLRFQPAPPAAKDFYGFKIALNVPASPSFIGGPLKAYGVPQTVGKDSYLLMIQSFFVSTNCYFDIKSADRNESGKYARVECCFMGSKQLFNLLNQVVLDNLALSGVAKGDTVDIFFGQFWRANKLCITAAACELNN